MDGNLVALVLGQLAFVAFVLWLATPFLRERTRRRAELQKVVFERFGSAKELAEFLETGPGRRLEESLSGRRAPLVRLVGAVQASLLLGFAGAGLGAAFWLTADPDLGVASLLLLSLGAGFGAAALVSHHLCRRLGLLPERSSSVPGARE